MSAEDAVGKSRPPSRRRLALKLVGGGIAVGIFAWTLATAWRRVERLQAAGGIPDPWLLLCATAVYMGANLVLADNWRYLMSFAGRELRRPESLWIWSASQLTRYTFSLGQIGARTAMVHRRGHGGLAAATTSVVELALFLTTTSTLMLATFPFWETGVSVPSWTLVLGAAPLAGLTLMLARPASAGLLADRCARIRWLPTGVVTRLRRFATVTPPSRSQLVIIITRYAANTCLRLLALFLILGTLTDADLTSATTVATTIGAHGLGSFIGGVVVVAPGGLGVREGSTALLLSTVVDVDGAALVVAAVRVLEVCAELLVVAGSWVLHRRRSGEAVA